MRLLTSRRVQSRQSCKKTAVSSVMPTRRSARGVGRRGLKDAAVHPAQPPPVGSANRAFESPVEATGVTVAVEQPPCDHEACQPWPPWQTPPCPVIAVAVALRDRDHRRRSRSRSTTGLLQ